jgi:hypothetical protein
MEVETDIIGLIESLVGRRHNTTLSYFMSQTNFRHVYSQCHPVFKTFKIVGNENGRQKIKIGDFFGSNIFGARATPETTSFLDCLKLKYIYFFILHLNRLNVYVLFVFHRSFNKLFRNCLFHKRNLGVFRWMSSDFCIRPKKKKNVFLVSTQNLIFTNDPNIFIDAKRLYPKLWKFPDRKHALSDLILILHQLF